MTIEEQIRENKGVYQSAILGFLVSSGALDLMDKKIFKGVDPVELQKIDARHSFILQNFNTPAYLDKITEDPELLLEFQKIISNITDLNKQLIGLAKAAITGER